MLWLYTSGLQQPPENTQSFQPWVRATYIGQNGMTAPGDRAFQHQPSPYDQPYDPASGSGCDPLLPATPHPNAMIVGFLDGSVRGIATSVSGDAWNKACLPNDGSKNPGLDWVD